MAPKKFFSVLFLFLVSWFSAQAKDLETKAIVGCMESLRMINEKSQVSVTPTFFRHLVGPNKDYFYDGKPSVTFVKGDSIYFYSEDSGGCQYPVPASGQLLQPCACSDPTNDLSTPCPNCCKTCISYNDVFKNEPCLAQNPKDQKALLKASKKNLDASLLEEALWEHLTKGSQEALNVQVRFEDCLKQLGFDSCSALVDEAKKSCRAVRPIQYNGRKFAPHVDAVFTRVDKLIAEIKAMKSSGEKILRSMPTGRFW